MVLNSDHHPSSSIGAQKFTSVRNQCTLPEQVWRCTTYLCVKIGMRSMGELFFGGVGRDGTLCIHNFQKSENIALHHFKRKKKNLIYLNFFVYFVVCCLYCLNTFVVSFAAVVWSRHTTPSIPRWRVSGLRDETITVAKEPKLTTVPLTERNQKSVALKI